MQTSRHRKLKTRRLKLRGIGAITHAIGIKKRVGGEKGKGMGEGIIRRAFKVTRSAEGAEGKRHKQGRWGKDVVCAQGPVGSRGRSQLQLGEEKYEKEKKSRSQML